MSNKNDSPSKETVVLRLRVKLPKHIAQKILEITADEDRRAPGPVVAMWLKRYFQEHFEKHSKDSDVQ